MRLKDGLRAHPEQCEVGSAVAPVNVLIVNMSTIGSESRRIVDLWKNQSLPREANRFLDSCPCFDAHWLINVILTIHHCYQGFDIG